MVPRVGNETLRPLGFGPCFGRKLQTKKLMMYSPGGPFIMVAPVVMSWAVAGQRMVFLHMYLQTRVTLKAFPVATPRGRSVSFPTRGTMVTYVTWDVFTVRFQQFFLNKIHTFYFFIHILLTPMCWTVLYQSYALSLLKYKSLSI